MLWLEADWIAEDTAYGSSDNLVWLTTKRMILLFIPVFDKGERTDGTFSRSDFTWGDENDRYICLGGKEMEYTRRTYSDPTGMRQVGGLTCSTTGCCHSTTSKTFRC
ncbi:MAG: hypothetical protein WBC93_03525 [Sulfitobacter sp.]